MCKDFKIGKQGGCVIMGSATMYKVVKNAYDAGRYSLDDMRLLVFVGRITAEQYNDITGIDYIKDEAGDV